MRKSIARTLVLLFVTALTVLMATDSIKPTVAAGNLVADPNPLLGEWAGPYSGVPPFDKVQVALFKPALEAAMAENLSEVEAIANNTAAPTFDNTLAAMERAG